MARPTEPLAQPLPTGREDKIRLIMRTFDLTRKPALRLLRDNGNDVNRTLKSKHGSTSLPEAPVNIASNATPTKTRHEPDPNPINTSNAFNDNASPPSKTQAGTNAPSHDISTLVPQLSLLSPLLSALHRELASTPTEPNNPPNPRARKKLSFYAYSVAHLPRSLSVLPPRPHKPRISTYKIPPAASDTDTSARIRELYEPAKKYPFNLLQRFLMRKNAMDVHVMGCDSRDDAKACLEGYEQSFDGRVVFVQGGERVFCAVVDLRDEWGFGVKVQGREVCRVVVVENEEVKEQDEVDDEEGEREKV